MMLCLNKSDIVKSSDYRCIFHGIRKSEVIPLLENSMFVDLGYILNAYQRNEF